MFLRGYREHLNLGSKGTAIKILYLIKDLDSVWWETYKVQKIKYPNLPLKFFKFDFIDRPFEGNYQPYKALESALLETIDYEKYQNLSGWRNRDRVKLDIASSIYKYCLTYEEKQSSLESKIPEKILTSQKILKNCILEALLPKYYEIMKLDLFISVPIEPFFDRAKAIAIHHPIFNNGHLIKIIHSYWQTTKADGSNKLEEYVECKERKLSP